MTPLKMNSDRVRRFLTPLLALTLAIPAFAQVTTKPAAPAPAPAAPAPVATTAAEADSSKDILQLSPFVVTTTKDQGYFAENTLAGSRLNSNLGDLASSITVVTKQQMEDTASLDINDIFRYEANTEGSSTYTPQVADRGTLKDTIGGYSFGNNGDTTTNAQSNRVRGLAAPDSSLNYHPSNTRIPFDSYNTQSVEISRGPNSLLFGLGSPAGIVNQTTAQAVLNRNTTTVSLRTDNVGSTRGSFAINRSLIDDKLAIYVATLYNNQQFERKPSYDLTRRQFGAVTYKPFPKTTIRAFAENFDNKANRPNFITPRDQVTPWLQAGRPAYDSVARTITLQDAVSVTLPDGTSYVRPAGTVLGPIYFDTRSPGALPIFAGTARLAGAALITNSASPFYIPFGIGFDTGNTPTLERLNNGSRIDYFQRNIGFYVPAHTNPATLAPNANAWVANDPRFLLIDRNWTASNSATNPAVTVNGQPGSYLTYNAPAVSNKSIYDWTKYNLNEPNYGELHASNYNLEIEQQLMTNLFFSAGWFRQQLYSSENYILSQLQGNTIQVDTNLKLMNGQPNPYFGLPYLPLGLGGGVDTFYAPETDDSYRAMLAYDLDLTKHTGWTKWLGRHRFLGLLSEQDVKRNRERWRLGYTDGDAEGRLRYARNLTLDGQANWSNSTIRKAYYLGNPGDPLATVSHSAGFYGNPGSEAPLVSQINAYNFNTNDFHDVTVSEKISFADNGSANFQREVKSWNLAAQSWLWSDRLVTTVGWRHDDYRARNTTAGAITDANGVIISSALTANEVFPFHTGEADYDRIMSRWTPWDKLSGDTKTLGVAFRPFQSWTWTDRKVNSGSMLGEFLNGLTFYYNQSDNFNPPANAQTDYFRKRLPKPTGDGKDIGLGFNLFNNKLVARVNWFETSSANERTALAGTLLTRLAYADTTTGIAWASAVQRLRNGIAAGGTIASITANPQWNTNAVNDVSDSANQQKIFDLIQLPLNYYSGLQLGATQQSKSKGVEVQVTYNPTPNWTMKLTGTKTESIFSDVAPQYDAWKAVRLPKWETSAATDIPDFVTIVGSGTREWSLSKFWTGYGYSPEALKENQNGQTSALAYFNQVVESEVATAKQLEGAVAPNQRIYHASFLTNYAFQNGRFKGFSTGGSLRWESRAAVGFYGKAANPLTPLVINATDVSRPIYLDNGNYYTDLWFAYSRKVFKDKVRMKIQLNINNVFEDGGLQAIAANFDGLPYGYRIVDPRQFVLTTTFDF